MPSTFHLVDRHEYAKIEPMKDKECRYVNTSNHTGNHCKIISIVMNWQVCSHFKSLEAELKRTITEQHSKVTEMTKIVYVNSGGGFAEWLNDLVFRHGINIAYRHSNK